MKREHCMTAAALLLIVVFVSAGVWVPDVFLHWQKEKLLRENRTVSKVSVSPYQSESADSERISQLMSLLTEEVYFSYDSTSLMEEREPKEGELSYDEATEIGDTLYDLIKNVAEQHGYTIGKQKNEKITKLYEVKINPQLSFWDIAWFFSTETNHSSNSTAEQWTTATSGLDLWCFIDAVSGVPLMVVVENGGIMDENAVMAEMVNFYSGRLDTEFCDFTYDEEHNSTAIYDEAAKEQIVLSGYEERYTALDKSGLWRLECRLIGKKYNSTIVFRLVPEK